MANMNPRMVQSMLSAVQGMDEGSLKQVRRDSRGVWTTLAACCFAGLGDACSLGWIESIMPTC